MGCSCTFVHVSCTFFCISCTFCTILTVSRFTWLLLLPNLSHGIYPVAKHISTLATMSTNINLYMYIVLLRISLSLSLSPAHNRPPCSWDQSGRHSQQPSLIGWRCMFHVSDNCIWWPFTLFIFFSLPPSPPSPLSLSFSESLESILSGQRLEADDQTGCCQDFPWCTVL